MRSVSIITRISVPILALGALASCDGGKTTQPAEVMHSHTSSLTTSNVVYESALATQIHAVAARFNSTVQAEKAGYASEGPCVASPAGAMGYHWVNESLVDPVFDPTKPEALLYVPDKNGKLRLVAVEYLVIDVDQPAPTFDGQPFDVGGSPIPVDHWSLHVWLYESNPSGLFAPFNPNVSCPANGT